MKKSYILLFFLISIFLTGCILMTNGITKGKKLYNDPTLGYGTTGKTCTTCHENGEGISNNFDTKNEYIVMGLKIKTLPEVINTCIEITLRGEGIDPQGEEMKALISYIQYLKRDKKSPRSK